MPNNSLVSTSHFTSTVAGHHNQMHKIYTNACKSSYKYEIAPL
jgi:hypothetical protein